MLRAALTAAVCIAHGTPSFGQGTGRSLDIDTSVRSSGMGGASGAVFWGGSPNEWANPAMLGYQRGIRYDWAKTQLVPGLAADVIFKTKRFSFGGGGIGLMTAGAPDFAPGSVKLDYGLSEGRDEQGNPTGTFNSFENIESWGVGVSASELARTIAAMAGSNVPAFTRYVDVAGGLAHKDIVIALAPGFPGGIAGGTGLDWGWVVRVTPIDVGTPSDDFPIPLRIDYGIGVSVLNFNDERVTFINEDQASPLSRIHRHGAASRFAIGVPAALRATLSGRAQWVWDTLDPLLSVGISQDSERITGGDLDDGFQVNRNGVEIVVANVVSIRRGHVTDREGDIDGDTKGWGLGLNLGRIAGFRIDRARIPQARDAALPEVQRKAFTVFIDPLALLRHSRPPVVAVHSR